MQVGLGAEIVSGAGRSTGSCVLPFRSENHAKSAITSSSPTLTSGSIAGNHSNRRCFASTTASGPIDIPENLKLPFLEFHIDVGLLDTGDLVDVQQHDPVLVADTTRVDLEHHRVDADDSRHRELTRSGVACRVKRRVRVREREELAVALVAGLDRGDKRVAPVAVRPAEADEVGGMHGEPTAPHGLRVTLDGTVDLPKPRLGQGRQRTECGVHRVGLVAQLVEDQVGILRGVGGTGITLSRSGEGAMDRV